MGIEWKVEFDVMNDCHRLQGSAPYGDGDIAVGWTKIKGEVPTGEEMDSLREAIEHHIELHSKAESAKDE